MVNCDEPSQPKNGIGNRPSVVEDLAGKLIQQPAGHINQSEYASPEPQTTTKIRMDVELICRPVSVSQLFELGQHHAFEHNKYKRG